jgi:hypothetical protein
LTCHKKGQNFSGKTFQGKLSRKNFPGKISRENFPGNTFQGKLSGTLSRENFPGKRESRRRTHRKRSLAKQDATRIATPELHEVHSRSLTAWDGQNPAGSSGHFWH